MPPKRRRATTAVSAISTALDSLRAKIHNFADTADEEQLREVAQLIDRLSSSNSGPFRLLDLPYELLEYTAERYFNRKEATPILSVNQVFNELFANRVWKSIGFDDMMVDECEVPMDVLMKNAKRVRIVKLWSIKPDFFVSGYFAYAKSISFDIKDGMEKMFTLHLEQMKYLRHVILAIDEMPGNVIDAAAKWIDDSHRSGHVQQIVISAASSRESQQPIYAMAFLMDKIKFKKRIRLVCTSVQPFPTSIVQYMPTTLTYLNIAEDIQRRCYSEVNKQVFGTYPDSARGVDGVINDSLVNSLMFLGCVVIAAITAAIGAIMVLVMNPWFNLGGNFTGVFIVLAFAVGGGVAGITTSVVGSGAAALFVCLSEQPEIMAITQPQLFDKIVAAYPAVVSRID
ncbi:hypothetical protein GQ42DRAFT_171398 [Ramicandelaber brevisporus]|nr:hypothetical protein GQ42DRAFT_171398 [Ramicandelaber brevisporus]